MITFTTTTLTLIVLILSALLILLVGIIIDLYMKLRSFTRGKNSGSLEETLRDIQDEYKEIHVTYDEVIKHQKNILSKMKTSIRGARMIRFNPFKDSGGNQSFACALINEDGNGMVLSTLFARDRMSVFGKPIENFTSTQTLSAEEEKALHEARSDMNLV